VRLSIASCSARAARELRLLELSFQFRFLSGRARAGDMADEDQTRLDQLRSVFEGDGPIHVRRQHRRFAAYLPVVVRTSRGQGHGILLNFSTSGMFLATHQSVEKDGQLQVKIGRPGEVEYLYTCEATRTPRGSWINGVACKVVGPPVELRPDTN